IEVPASLRSEDCSPSPWNAVRVPSGISVRLRRNPQWDLVVRPSAFSISFRAPSGSLACNVLACSQIRRQLFLCLKHPPLHRPDRDGLGGGDLVVFPLLDKAQRHDFALARIQKGHPVQELECRSTGRLLAVGYQAIRDLCQVDSLHFPRLFAMVTAESITGNLE